MLVSYCIANLREIKTFLNKLTNEQYVYPCDSLSGASIGQHVRHILEFYLCLIQGIRQRQVNYDLRERDLLLETDLNFAINKLDKMVLNISILPSNMYIQLIGNYGDEENREIIIQSSVERELVYCLEHAIHHMALIKVAAIDQSIVDKIGLNFGVAPSTIRNRTITCAQ